MHHPLASSDYSHFISFILILILFFTGYFHCGRDSSNITSLLDELLLYDSQYCSDNLLSDAFFCNYHPAFGNPVLPHSSELSIGVGVDILEIKPSEFLELLLRNSFLTVAAWLDPILWCLVECETKVSESPVGFKTRQIQEYLIPYCTLNTQ